MNKQQMKELRGKLQVRIGTICDAKDKELETRMSREELDVLRNTVVDKLDKIGYEYLEEQYTRYAKGLVSKKDVNSSIDYLINKIEGEIAKIENTPSEEVLTKLAPLGFYCSAFDYIGENLM